MVLEQTLAIIKPDAVHRSYEILDDIVSHGFTIVRVRCCFGHRKARRKQKQNRSKEIEKRRGGNKGLVVVLVPVCRWLGPCVGPDLVLLFIPHPLALLLACRNGGFASHQSRQTSSMQNIMAKSFSTNSSAS